MRKSDKNFALLLLVFLFFLNLLAWSIVWDLSQPPFLEVIFFDVGQGDAIFIETPQRHQILIDGGPTSVILEKLAKEMPFWDRSIDLIILTHPEHDHLRGLIDVLKRYKVENIFWTGVVRDTAEYKEWLKAIEKEGGKIKIVQAGQKVGFSTSPGGQWTLEIFYPFENLEGKEFKNSNNTSIIAKLIFDKNSFLFTGDAYKEAERELVAKGVNISSNILKIGHHGSKTSSSEEFLEKVLPEIAIISVGRKNPYGHPHQEVLKILERYDIKVLRTDLLGDIKIISSGKKYEVSHFQN